MQLGGVRGWITKGHETLKPAPTHTKFTKHNPDHPQKTIYLLSTNPITYI